MTAPRLHSDYITQVKLSMRPPMTSSWHSCDVIIFVPTLPSEQESISIAVFLFFFFLAKLPTVASLGPHDRLRLAVHTRDEISQRIRVYCMKSFSAKFSPHARQVTQTPTRKAPPRPRERPPRQSTQAGLTERNTCEDYRVYQH